MSFDAYLAYLRDAERGVGLPSGWVPFTMLFAFVGDELIGRASLRHELNEFLATVGGHIGYLVLTDRRPCDADGHGNRDPFLAQALAHARSARSLPRSAPHLQRGQRALAAHDRARRARRSSRLYEPPGRQAAQAPLLIAL